MKQIDWYFDFISPFAYLASQKLDQLPAGTQLCCHPLLFAGLLEHWQTRGPAEIPSMRQFTFRHIQWLADKNGIPLHFPPGHPFNPLKLLRLCIVLGSTVESAQRLFRFVWAEGKSSDNPDDWRALIEELGIADADQRIAEPEIKSQLRENTEAAIKRGVFGVPTFIVDNQIFWGFDSLDFLKAYLKDSTLLQSAGMRAADSMPVGVHRSSI